MPSHQSQSMRNGLQGFNLPIWNKQTHQILPQLCSAFSEIGKPLKISRAGVTNPTCQNNSSGFCAPPCCHISRGMLKTRGISSWINSPGILLLRSFFMSGEDSHHVMVRLGNEGEQPKSLSVPSELPRAHTALVGLAPD